MFLSIIIMENSKVTENIEEETTQTTQTTQTAIKDITIDNENIALNVIVGMLNIAQKRGAFSLEESAKTWECVQMFMRVQPKD
jgi:hypothetical protein